MMKRTSKLFLALPVIGILSWLQQPSFDLKASTARGKALYMSYCLSCHSDQGQGLEGVYPPLAKSDYLMADKKRAIQLVLYGTTGEMKVNGKTYTQPMAGFDLKDAEVSDILNYIRNAFGNKGGAVKPEEVKALRKQAPSP